MSIITISRGSYSKGKEVAEEVGSRLGYQVISRDLILETSKEFNVPEIKMVRAIHDAPSILSRLGSNRKRYVAYFRYLLLDRIKEDNIVYHGLAGHFFLEGLSNLLKVRILADMDDRARLEAEREGISFEKAKSLLKKDDEERRKWSYNLYGTDPQDPGIYDMVLHIKKLGTDDAADLICRTVEYEQFQSTAESRQKVEDMRLAALAKVKLVEKYPDAEVSADKGSVNVKLEGLYDQEDSLKRKVEELVSTVPGVDHCSVSMVYMDR